MGAWRWLIDVISHCSLDSRTFQTKTFASPSNHGDFTDDDHLLRLTASMSSSNFSDTRAHRQASIQIIDQRLIKYVVIHYFFHFGVCCKHHVTMNTSGTWFLCCIGVLPLCPSLNCAKAMVHRFTSLWALLSVVVSDGRARKSSETSPNL